jgi:hypothetical protein
MLRFKEFIAEEGEVHLDVDPKLALSNLDKANDDLDKVTDATFRNSAVFINAVRGTLERYGILLPAFSNMQQLSMEGETVYALGDSGMHVYMVHNLNNEGAVEGYATIVNKSDLDDLLRLKGEPDESIPDAPDSNPGKLPWYPKARRDDDSGNDNEYA